MKYIIKDTKLFSNLENLVYEKFPELELPLKQERHFYEGLRDSGRYTYAKISYLTTKGGEIIFNEFSQNHPYENVTWEVNDKLERIYKIVGENLFVYFIKEFFGINLTDKGTKEYDWVFR